MLNPIVYHLLLIAVAAYAFLRGRSDERLAAAICVFATVATRLVLSPTPERYSGVEIGEPVSRSLRREDLNRRGSALGRSVQERRQVCVEHIARSGLLGGQADFKVSETRHGRTTVGVLGSTRLIIAGRKGAARPTSPL